MLNTNTDHYLRINEIKNHIYCPRISFYALCLGLDRETAVSQIGIENEADTKKRMKRREHALHAIHDGTRHFDVEVVIHNLQLLGRLDEVIETPEGVYLVDYKDTDTDYGYWRVQMMAYRLGIEAQGTTVLGTYVYTIPDQTYHKLRLTKKHTTQLNTIITSLQTMIATEVCPDPTPHVNKCYTCQYNRFCNDVD